MAQKTSEKGLNGAGAPVVTERCWRMAAGS